MGQVRSKGKLWVLVGRVLLSVAVAIVVMPSVTGVAGAAEGLALGQAGGWWASVQETIQEGLARSGTAGFGGIEGLSTDPDWMATGENTSDWLGWSAATAGDVNGDGYADLLVDAVGFETGSGQGKVYLYYGSATGLSTTPGWTATGENAGAWFGSALSSAGDVNGDGYSDVIVGAYGHDDGTTDQAGKVYVYHGGASGLSANPDWTVTGQAEVEWLGASVGGAGDVNGDGYADVIVGAPGAGTTQQGAAYVYHGSATGLSSSPAWQAEGESATDLLGDAVAGCGDVNGDGYADILVGADRYDDGANEDAGRVYVYYGSATGLSPDPDWFATGEAASDRFGFPAVGAGDVNGDGYADIVVAAIQYSEVGPGQVGKVYVFHGSGSGLRPVAEWTVTGENGGDQFGSSAAGVGDVNGDGYADIAVGAPAYFEGGYYGRAYVYMGGASGLGASPAWIGDGEDAEHTYGHATMGAGDVDGDGYADLVVGAPSYDSVGMVNQGRAYVYHGAGDTLGASEEWSWTGEASDDRLGQSVASAGDVNGDGYADVIVGAPQHVGLPPDLGTGLAYAFYGSASGPSASPDWTAAGEEAGDSFGLAVASAGDVNGDGYADVIVGARGRGKAYVYHGSPDGLDTDPAWTAAGPGEADGFGASVASAGDVNGDGYGDVVVAAYPLSPSDPSAVYAFYGSAAGLSVNPDWTLAGMGGGLGDSVASAGDVNGDGYGDLIVGDPWYNDGTDTWAGRAAVFSGSALGLGASPVWTAVGDSSYAHFGASVAGAGDVNRDGYADLIVGASQQDTLGPTGPGKAYVFAGSASGPGASPLWTAMGESHSDAFGESTATAGDVNGDGYADVIVGARFHDSQGAAYVFHGSETGPGVTADWTASAESQLDSYGTSVASAGDVNGDGYADVIVGASVAESTAGRVYVYLGNDGGGRLVLAQQARADGSRLPVQPWGLSHVPDGFYLRMWTTDPMGRGRVKLEVEACPPGVAFGDAACARHRSSAWKDVTATASGIQVATTISGLDAETLYRWRARVLWAPYTVDQPGIAPPANPAHGPWRRFLGQAMEADLRTTEAAAPAWKVFLPVVVRE